MKTSTPFVIAALLAGAWAAGVQETTVAKVELNAPRTTPEHVMLMPADLQWKDAGPALPPGAQMAVLEGDPKQPGPFTIRFKAPDGYRVPPHSHPADEHVTVISGALGLGMGDLFDPAKGRELAAGGFSVMPAGVHHFAWIKGETVIQVHGIGPWGINYVNPADDPQKKSGQ